MTTVEILGVVQQVLRRCRVCDQVKPLEHYLLKSNQYAQVRDVKVCAACRTPSYRRKKDRRD